MQDKDLWVQQESWRGETWEEVESIKLHCVRFIITGGNLSSYSQFIYLLNKLIWLSKSQTVTLGGIQQCKAEFKNPTSHILFSHTHPHYGNKQKRPCNDLCITFFQGEATLMGLIDTLEILRAQYILYLALVVAMESYIIKDKLIRLIRELSLILQNSLTFDFLFPSRS